MNLDKLNDVARQVLLNKQSLEEETLTEAKKLTAAAIVKMFKNADEWGDDMKHQVRNLKGNLEFVDSYWAGSDDALKRLITSWTSPNGTYAKFFREEYGATFKLVDKFTLMQATGRYKKVSDNGIVGVVLSIQGGTIKESEELEEEALNEAFARLPGNVINNELFSAGKDLQAFISAQRNGDDVNEKQLAGIIKSLQGVKKEVKKFKTAEEVPLSFQYKKA